MTEPDTTMAVGDNNLNQADTDRQPPERRMHKRANMHDGIPVWYDCCSCEAEPYWAAVAEEMGTDLNGDAGDAEDGIAGSNA